MKNNGFAHVLILVLVVLGIGALGYFGWQNGFIKFDFSPQRTDKSQANVTQTTNWINYVSKFYGLTIEYPDGWDLYDKGAYFKDESNVETWSSPKEYVYISPNKLPDQVPEGTEFSFSGVLIKKADNKFNNIDEAFEKLNSENSAEKVKIAGHDAVKTTSDSTLRGGVDGFPKYVSYQILIPGREQSNIFVGLTYSKNEEYLIKIFEEMVNRIKVIDTTCKFRFSYFENEVYSFCYPSDMRARTSVYKGSFNNPNNTSYKTFIEGDSGIITVTTSFVGGWGGDSCLKDKTQVDGYETDILGWDLNGGEACDTNFISLIAITRKPNEKLFPIVIDYQRKDTAFVQKENFDEVLKTFKVNVN